MASKSKSPYEQWLECAEFLNQCREELLNAQSMGDKPRIAQCRRWVAEAELHEREARAAMTQAAQNGNAE